MGVRKRSTKIAKESNGLTISDMSHFPWCGAGQGFAVDTKAPPDTPGSNRTHDSNMHLRNDKNCYKARGKY